ncbi:MAG: helix-turn-helix transcriptional regulator [Rhodospirillaceae bacterium]|nr:helix-turn-helix transcriptional regulator [Rhodospirillaceae bacterium]
MRTDVTAAPNPPPFGKLLKEWRQARGASQLDFALDSGISQRHLSFLESGRSRPSRSMVLHLASALAVPLRQQNAMLLAAGFAPAFAERHLDAPELGPIIGALDRALAQQEPFPAVVIDRLHNLVRANRATSVLIGSLLGGALPVSPDAAPNLARLTVRQDGLRPYLENWEETVIWLLRRMRAEALVDGAPANDRFFAELLAEPDVARLAHTPREEGDYPPILTVRFRRGDTRLALFSMIATMGTPLDVALQDLRLELFFPADAATERWFRDRASDRPAAGTAD